jgi:hypothetical protein
MSFAWADYGGIEMSLELFVEKLSVLLDSAILEEEIAAGLLLRIEISQDGVRFEGVRSAQFCPDKALDRGVDV